MNTYHTANQAVGVARTLSKSSACTIVVYQAGAGRYVTARPTDSVSGLVIGVYRNGYLLPSGQRA
ncbi:MAG: hypothetical protein J7549_01835 [Variovorax sp.]|nr:hypothetical protein [Variovorax sp.]